MEAIWLVHKKHSKLYQYKWYAGCTSYTIFASSTVINCTNHPCFLTKFDFKSLPLSSTTTFNFKLLGYARNIIFIFVKSQLIGQVLSKIEHTKLYHNPKCATISMGTKTFVPWILITSSHLPWLRILSTLATFTCILDSFLTVRQATSTTNGSRQSWVLFKFTNTQLKNTLSSQAIS